MYCSSREKECIELKECVQRRPLFSWGAIVKREGTEKGIWVSSTVAVHQIGVSWAIFGGI